MSDLRICTFCLVFLTTMTSISFAQQTGEDKQENEKGDQEKRYKQFEESMSGVKLVGRFTVLGKDDGPLPKEEYTIKSVKKLPEGDYWMFTARIKYGNKDVTLPLPIEVKWADDTPIITLTDFTVPTMGTFSSRVVIYNKKYAGTWTHGKVGGHLFGTVEKIESNSDTEN